MKPTRALLALVVATTSGCATASRPYAQPADITVSRLQGIPVEVGSVRSPVELQRVLPQVLAEYGYAIAITQQPAAEQIQFLTEWRTRAAFADESFTGTQQVRTRLVVDARKRGPRYAFAIYALNLVQDDQGAWREIGLSSQLRGHVRDISRRLNIATN